MECSLTAMGINSFDPSTSILLEDTQEDYIQNLPENPSYSFNEGTEGPMDRFILQFIAANDVNSNKLNIFACTHSYNSDIYVKLPPSCYWNCYCF